MIDAVDLQPGHTVLELAAGPGDTGFLAPSSSSRAATLITSDVAPEMLDAAPAPGAGARARRTSSSSRSTPESIDLDARLASTPSCAAGGTC